MKFKYLITFILFVISTAGISQDNSIIDPDILFWESDIDAFEKLDSIETYSDSALLFTGSSSIRLWENIKEDMANYEVIKRGYGGAKLDDFSYYLERIIYSHNFRAVVIFVANDIANSENDKSPQEVLFLYKEIVEKIRKKYSDQPIFWIQITPTESRWKVWEEIQKANLLIKDFCDANANLFYIKTADLFLNNEGLPKAKYFVEDKLHLNKEGYKIWAERISSEIGKVLTD